MNEHKPMEGLAQFLRSLDVPGYSGPYYENLRRWADEVEAASLQRGDARTPQDYAIEHAEYMAVGAQSLLDAIETLSAAELRLAESGKDDYGDVADALDSVWANTESVRARIYEFRKRRDRALASRLAVPPSSLDEPVCWQWRKKSEPWTLEKTFNSRVLATTPDSEVRALYAAPQPQPAGVPQQAPSDLAYVLRHALDCIKESAEYKVGNPAFEYSTLLLTNMLRSISPIAPAAQPSIRAALEAPGCERLRAFYAVGPVQRAAVEAFAAAIGGVNPSSNDQTKGGA